MSNTFKIGHYEREDNRSEIRFSYIMDYELWKKTFKENISKIEAEAKRKERERLGLKIRKRLAFLSTTVAHNEEDAIKRAEDIRILSVILKEDYPDEVENDLP